MCAACWENCICMLQYTGRSYCLHSPNILMYMIVSPFRMYRDVCAAHHIFVFHTEFAVHLIRCTYCCDNGLVPSLPDQPFFRVDALTKLGLLPHQRRIHIRYTCIYMSYGVHVPTKLMVLRFGEMTRNGVLADGRDGGVNMPSCNLCAHIIYA